MNYRRINTQQQQQIQVYPIMLRSMTNEETKQYHRKKLYELSLKHIGDIPQLDEPTEEQKEWVLRKLKRWSK